MGPRSRVTVTRRAQSAALTVPHESIQGMRVPEFDQLAARLLAAADHPEIVAVRLTATSDRPQYHSRLEVECADGSKLYVMIERVEGPGIPRHASYELPREAMSA